MIKLASLAAIRSYRFSSQSRRYIPAWERKFHQLNNDATPTRKSQNTDSIGTGDLFSQEVFDCMDGVCGNASENEFFYSNAISMYNQEEELVTAEDEENDTLRISDDGSEYETLRITTTGDVMHVAMKLLAKKGLSVAELRHMLSQRFPLDIVDKVIEVMKNRGYLNDGLYAESFSRSRFLHYYWGPELIKQVLLLKGVADQEAEKAIIHVFQENYDYHNNMLKVTTSKNNNCYDYDVEEEELSQSAMEYLYLQASKQWSRERNISFERRKVNMIRWLRDRSFSSSVTGAILKRLWSENFHLD